MRVVIETSDAEDATASGASVQSPAAGPATAPPGAISGGPAPEGVTALALLGARAGDALSAGEAENPGPAGGDAASTAHDGGAARA